MQRGKKTSFILRQFKKKSKRVVNKDYFTEFFYLNKNREVIEFLKDSNGYILENFFKEFVKEEFKEFVEINILNENETPINLWYYNEENLVLVIKINWGISKQEISVDIDIENFEITIINDNGKIKKSIDYTMFNDYLISFLTIQARNLSESFKEMMK